MDKQSATAIPALGRAQSSHAAVRLDLLSILHGPPMPTSGKGKYTSLWAGRTLARKDLDLSHHWCVDSWQP